ncbi:hypothetical protein DSO57_1024151 [Entomophthora muscae]|uniref:Uncharacterized protein n=1 Tax=Entomophthora muscae TaxID=34485 RepID=A0ACC2UCB0_9FUNG|nr:hypothetical protein DSO57_1024151 [Entomophthora muscae]
MPGREPFSGVLTAPTLPSHLPLTLQAIEFRLVRRNSMGKGRPMLAPRSQGELAAKELWEMDEQEWMAKKESWHKVYKGIQHAPTQHRHPIENDLALLNKFMSSQDLQEF